MGTPPIFPYGNTGGEGNTRFVTVTADFFYPLRPADTSPIFCVARHRRGRGIKKNGEPNSTLRSTTNLNSYLFIPQL